ncbi:ABC transporter ATP-binding protein [Rhodobacteraceae bacterium CCMM004]|nr:ABC transporter ATP-binding protein [Rhodobacteraceae bacterium CCMM004]
MAAQTGRVTAIVGESGSGKSQLVKALTGLSPGAVSGTVTVDGAAIPAGDRRRLSALRGARVAYVFQDPMTALNPYFRIGPQLAEVARVHLGLSRRAARARALEMLTRVRLAEPQRRLDAYPHELSGGQRQRAVIAMALMAEPRLLIADEPTTALDATAQLGILDLVRALCDGGEVAAIFITHDIAAAARIGDRILVMQAGRVVEEGAARAVIAGPGHAYTRALIAATPSLAAPAAAARAQTAAAAILEVRGLHVAYPGGGVLARRAPVCAVRGVDFAVARGETLGLVGESGSGKSSVARALLRLAPVTAGEVRFDGRAVQDLSTRDFAAVRRGMQMVFQDPFASLNPRMRVRDLVDEPLRTHLRDWSARRRADAAAEALDAVGLAPDLAGRFPHELSGGQAQRVGIARAIVTEPKVLICDEAVSALDVSVQARILDLIAEVQARRGLAIVFITHDLAVVRQIADRIVVMKDGAVVEAAPRDRLFAAPRHAYTRRLIDAALKIEA